MTDQTQPGTTPTTPIGERRAIGHAHRLAASAADLVSMPLGQWAGNGDWATYSDDFRTTAGARALSELDAAITELLAVRDRLVQAVEGDGMTDQPAADPRPAVAEWTWRQHQFIGVAEATTDRAQAETHVRTCQAANPTADVGLMRRYVTQWEPTSDTAEPDDRSFVLIERPEPGRSTR